MANGTTAAAEDPPAGDAVAIASWKNAAPDAPPDAVDRADLADRDASEAPDEEPSIWTALARTELRQLAAVRQHAAAATSATPGVRFVYVTFDLETTGLDCFVEGITQLAACIDELPGVSFVTYVRTTRRISKKISDITGITAATLERAPAFREAFCAFIGWLVCALAGIRAATPADVTVRPVLVAHNGATFDFPFLFNEMRRAGIALHVFQLLSLHTADTLELLREVKARGEAFPDEKALLDAAGSLSLPKLYPFLFSGESYAAHDALADVQALARVLSNSPLSSPRLMRLFNEQLVKSPDVRLAEFCLRVEARAFHDELCWPGSRRMVVVPKQLADELFARGLSLEALRAILDESGGSQEAFVARLGSLLGVGARAAARSALGDLARFVAGGPRCLPEVDRQGGAPPSGSS